MTLGERIEATRLDRGLRMNELARRAGLSSGYVSLLERDTYRHVSVFTVRKVADALGASIDDLMEGVDDP